MNLVIKVNTNYGTILIQNLVGILYNLKAVQPKQLDISNHIHKYRLDLSYAINIQN